MGSWTERVRAITDERLASYLREKHEEALRLSPRSVELVDSVTALTMRGGKRVRPMVLVAGFHAVAPRQGLDGALAATIEACVAIEILQSYLLIHDDWMDLDEERRGGPSVYAALRDAHGDAHIGASLAVLAGDLASAYAAELISAAPFPSGRMREGLGYFWGLQREVFFGQHLDLLADDDVERMYDLKTGSYTVRGPLRIGAVLADADARQLAALDRFAAPLGIAFQLRDELLGTFGDSTRTGKPAGNDLRAGKRTMLITEARRRVSPAGHEALDHVFGRHDASDPEVAAAVEALVSSGARELVEKRLDGLVREARGALAEAELETEYLDTLLALLVDRST